MYTHLYTGIPPGQKVLNELLSIIKIIASNSTPIFFKVQNSNQFAHPVLNILLYCIYMYNAKAKAELAETRVAYGGQSGIPPPPKKKKKKIVVNNLGTFSSPA